MLHVEVHDASNATWLRVEGRFVGAFAEDTKAMVVRCKLPSHLVVDLSEVTFVDAEGEEVLLWLARIGAQFVANNCYSLDVCERLHLPILQKRELGASGRVVKMHARKVADSGTGELARRRHTGGQEAKRFLSPSGERLKWN